MKPIVRATNLYKSYRLNTVHHGKPTQGLNNAPAVLQNVNFELPPGVFTAIVGRSGSGKSTLLNIIGAMDTPDSGEVYISDNNICALNDEERARYRRKQLGFIFQSYNLIPTLTVAENLLLPAELAALTHEPNIRECLRQVGLHDKGEQWPEQLSGGEQQRVAVARALIHQPQLVLADEPTGNLDQDNAIKIVELLASMVKQLGTSLLLATHDMTICDYADRVLRIESGRLHQL